MRTKSMFILVSLIVVLSFVLSACSTPAATATSGGTAMDELIAAAKKEGNLTVIALPHDWCNYG